MHGARTGGAVDLVRLDRFGKRRDAEPAQALPRVRGRQDAADAPARVLQGRERAVPAVDERRAGSGRSGPRAAPAGPPPHPAASSRPRGAIQSLTGQSLTGPGGLRIYAKGRGMGQAPARRQSSQSVKGECPERQRGRTVNPLANAFVGSSPTSPTIRTTEDGGQTTDDARIRPRKSVICRPTSVLRSRV